MKKRLLPFFLLIIIHSTYAQDSSFQLKDYKYRTPGYKALNLDLSLSGSVGDNNAIDYYHKKQSHFDLYPSNLYYYHTVNTDKRIHSSTIRFSPAGGHSSFNQNDTVSRSNALQYNLYWNHNDRFYKQNNWFWEWGNNLDHSLGSSNSKYLANKYTSNNLLAENTLMLGIGKGRVENVSDAQMALYILNDLGQQGLLNSQPNAEQTKHFAELITSINNKRVFDNRKKRIYEFTQMDSFLKTSGLITVNDIRYFTTLNDNWVMAYNPYRSSGANWYVHILPGAGIHKTSNDSRNETVYSSNRQQQTYANFTPLIGYGNYKPVSLKWQRNFVTIISYHKKWNTIKNTNVFLGSETISKTDSKEWNAELYSKYGWGYFPNNRTAVNASFQLDASYGKAPEAIPFRQLRFIKPGIEFSADYFLSFRTRITAYWNLNYKSSYAVTNLNETVKWHEFYTSFSFGLSHAIL
jgi:hypothetical protein